MWRDIPGWEGLYQASDTGEIKSIRRNKVMKQFINKHKRCYVRLYAPKRKNKNCTVHRLVALTYIPNPEEKPQINHKDGNTLNNSVENLEWTTSHENMEHAYRSGLMPNTKRRNESGRKPLMSDKGEYFSCAYECAAVLGVKPATVRDALKGRIKTAKGRELRYIDNREWGQSNG